MKFYEGMPVSFASGKYKGTLGAYDEGWYVKTNDFASAWPWDERLPSSVLNRGDLCYWFPLDYIQPLNLTTKLGNTLCF